MGSCALMLGWLKTKADERHKARELYGAVVARARDPLHYTRHGLPDTPEGRYEAIVLELVLVLDRLSTEGDPGRALSRHTVEAFITDMDDCMREIGIGDLIVPRKVKQAAAGLYQRLDAYRDGLRSAEVERLELRLGGMLDEVKGDRTGAGALARHMRTTASALASLPGAALVEGRLPSSAGGPPADNGE